ncbi:ArsA family ATPase [Streptomyces sp. NPDC057445]|uniref:ArsA family ATPase n=1 Tax=Streptomyces sp. NPDC057445 TaxID=3346136 RepID=UPI00368F4155
MRTVLVTGPGGSGRTTVAAATALAAARRGKRTLLLSGEADAALGVTVGTGPGRVTDRLWAARTDSGAHFRGELLAFQERSSAALDLLGAHKLEDEELTELPGSEQFALLRALRDLRGGDWDVVVVDMPPARETIALLGLPEQLRRYLRRLLPPERQAARALRPVLAQLAGVPMPGQWLYETAARWESELSAVQELIEDRNTTVRLVAEPGPAGETALGTARLGLALYGMRTDTVVPNRVLPPASPDPWLTGLHAQQEKVLRGWYEEWLPESSLCEVRHLGRDPRGLDDLTALDTESSCTTFEAAGTGGGLFPGDGLAVELEPSPPGRTEPWEIQGPGGFRGVETLQEDGMDGKVGDDEFHWVLPLPGAVKEQVQLVRRGDELLLVAGPFRRIVPLPSALRRCTVSGAGLKDSELRVRFTPDPGLWPRAR